MSEFEGYQEGGNAPAATDAEYASMGGEGVAVPVEEPDDNLTAKGVNAAESKVNALVEKIGKNGVLLGIFVSSLIYTIASGTACFTAGYACVGVNAYAFSAGIISLIVSLVYLILLRFTQMLPDGSLAHQIFAWFFVAWWVGGTGTGTFSSPFITTGNGYFSAWGALLFSIVFLTLTSPIFKAQADRLKSALVSASFGDQIGLIVSSVVCLIDASASYVADGYSAYAISVACVSIVLTAITIFLVTASDKNPGYVRAFAWIAAFLFGWWVIGFCVTTFRAPFTTTGNGYFGAIGGCLFSMRLLQTTTLWKGMTDKMSGIVGGSGAGSGGAATYAEADEQPQYASSSAYATEEGMDF